jgi:lipopolysaccharide/colanic/teichoic acid biosynthesis glycosyltransferase
MTKRLMDVAGALAALILLCPLMALLCVLIRMNLGRPVFFRQARPGRHGRMFQMFKFRTMREAYRPDGTPLPDAERMTPFGRLLRSSSLDELPELWNVLRGDMSLVGPRPLLADYLSLYSARQQLRHEVRPGITGWAQINGRNSLSWADKFEFDVWYVENQSLALDLRILWLTLDRVLRRDGISAEGHATMEPFHGNKE